MEAPEGCDCMAKGKFKLNRKQYLEIKKMDHGTMSAWLENIYKAAHKDGMEDAEGLTIDDIRPVLLAQKGIGEKKVEVICSALVQAMEVKKDKSSD